jgi:hypothetical protein
VSNIKKAMISSTVRDLPEYRETVKEACLKTGAFPVMMDHLPANADDAITASLKMVDDADIYLGIFAHRYGYIPKDARNPDEKSITQLEYEHAVKQGKTLVIFIMSDDQPIKLSDMETGKPAKKLTDLKAHLKTSYVVGFFTTPADLHAKAIHALTRA